MAVLPMACPGKPCYPLAPLAALLTGLLAVPAGAEIKLRDVVVTATRAEVEVDRVAASISSITRAELDRRLPSDAADLFRDEPDVALARDLRRFGATSPNIRGLEDKRVLQLVDGVRLPDYYRGGGPTNFTTSAPLTTPPDFLKRVEVLRGPASSLYGSDALGGVVGYLTLDPDDLLRPGETLAFRPKLTHTGANEGLTGTLLAAGGQEQGVQWLLGYTRSRTNEFDNQGRLDVTAPNRERPNPQEVRDQGLLAKLAMKPALGHALKLTLEGAKQDSDVVVKRLSAALPKVTAMEGDDHARRVRAMLEWRHLPSGGVYDRLTARLYRQDSESTNYNRQTRTNTNATCSATFGIGNDCRIEQEFRFDQTLTGVGAQVEKGWGNHFLIAGLELFRLETAQRRDATVRNLTANTSTKTLAGDAFPLRDFAPGYTDTVGLYVQDEIELAGGRFTLTPGLRYDWRKLKPEPDALSQAVLAANNKQAASQSDGAFSPKLAWLWQLDGGWSAFGHVARGFRAPSYDEVNGHFRNTTQSYGVAPNPDLKPETSVGGELGVRLARGTLRGQLSVYDNRYEDFIESVRLNCPMPFNNPARDPRCIPGLANTNTSVNLNRVRIYGAEARMAWDMRPGWRLTGALAYAHGQDEELDRPLDSIEPTRLMLAVTRDAGRWGAEARLRAARGVHRVNDCTTVACTGTGYSPWFRPPGYGVLDLSAWFEPVKGARVALAVNNLTDRKYWLWSDIRNADARNPQGVDFYSQPGRSVSASLEYRF